MKNKIVHFGTVDEKGTLTLNQRRTFLLEIHSKFKGKSVRLTVESVSSKRSLSQNNYYYGVIVPRCKSGFNRLGWTLSETEAHQKLAEMFLSENKVNQLTGEIFHYVRSTADLSTVEFSDYMDSCINFGAMELDEIIAYPDEK